MQEGTADPMRAAEEVAESGGLARETDRELARWLEGLREAPRVGRYVIEKKLAEGGMGAIFRARDPELDRPVAIKIPHPRVDEDTRGLVAQEARALARLNHPNVLVVHDLGSAGGQLWLAMEFVSGKNLADWRDAHREATWRDIVRLFVAAGQGLAAAHDANVVHRDVKPENIMIGDDGRVRIADFGLALIEGTTQDRSARPDLVSGIGSDRHVAGTPDFVAPELLEGAMPGPLADQYSFFMTLLETIPTPGAPATRSRESLPGALIAVIERGLAPEPSRRYPSMHAAVAQLEALLAAPLDDPRRRALLDRVEQAWLEGVLARTLDGHEAAPLPLSEASELVEPPWSGRNAPRPRRYQPTTQSLRSELVRARGALLLVGMPGAGKTTALLGLAATLLKRAREEATEPVPVVLNLASLSLYEGPFSEWLVAELVIKYGLPRQRARRWLDDDAMVLLLDGLDEVAGEQRRKVALAIDAFRAEHPVTTVVACREDNYRALEVRLRFGLAMRIEPPDEATIAELCHGYGAAGEAALETLHAHAGGPPPSPLVISLLVRARIQGQYGDVALAGLYDRLVESALERPPPLPPRERTRLLGLLGWLGRTLARTDNTDLWLERMQIEWLPSGGLRFVARVLSVVAMYGILLGGNLLGNALAGRPTFFAFVLAAFSLVIALGFNRGLRIRHREGLRWSWRLSLRRAPLMLGIGLALGLVFGAIYIMWVNLVLCTAGALVLTLVVGLEPSDREGRMQAGAGLLRAAKTCLIVGPATGLATGLAVGYVAASLILPNVGPTSELLKLEDPQQSLFWTSGVFVTMLVGFIYGGTTLTLYGTLRLVQTIGSGTPLLLARWLDKAVDRGLLRRVGGGWIFLHRSLLQYFARRGEQGAAKGGDT